jgi:MFS family permease
VSHRVAARLAWSLCALSLLLLTLSLVLIVLERSTAEEFPWQAQAISAVGSFGAPVLGGLVASRRPGNPIGWMWLGIGLGVGLSSFAGSYATYALGPASLPAPRAIGTVVAGVGWTVAFALITLILLLFPTGRLPSRRWRFLAWAVAAAAALALISGPFVPGRSGFAPVQNPFGVEGFAGEVIFVLTNASVIVVLVATVPAALSLVFRYRRASGVERQQIKWFAYAAVLFGSLIPLDLLGLDEPLGDVLWNVLNALATLGIYAAVGVAILRHRLYEIDLIINRTLVYGSLTVTLALSYLGGVVALQAIFRAVTGEGSQLAIVASTLAIAALFNPLRRRVQAFVDRLFYRRKYDAAKTLGAFSSKLRDETDLDRLGGELVSVVRSTVQPEHASLWLRGKEESR